MQSGCTNYIDLLTIGQFTTHIMFRFTADCHHSTFNPNIPATHLLPPHTVTNKYHCFATNHQTMSMESIIVSKLNAPFYILILFITCLNFFPFHFFCYFFGRFFFRCVNCADYCAKYINFLNTLKSPFFLYTR